MSESNFEAKLYALRKSKDGVIVSFVVHPSDVTSDLMTLDIGAHLMIGWAECKDSQGESSRAAKGEASVAPWRETEAPRESSKPKRPFKDLSYPEQAGIRCEDGQFREFLFVKYSDPACTFMGRHEAAEVVRNYCGIKSRAELSTDHDAANQWRKLEAEYQSWLATQKYAESIRR